MIQSFAARKPEAGPTRHYYAGLRKRLYDMAENRPDNDKLNIE
jgi:hypothetical protein